MIISELKMKARASLDGNWGISMLVMIVVSLISSAVNSITGGFGALLTPVLGFGVCSYYLIMVRTGSAKFETVFTDTFSDFLKKWGVTLLRGLYIWLWSLLFIIPGIVKSYSYAMTNYILLDNPEMGIDEAITASRKMMDGYKWKLFCLDLSFILWHLLAWCTCGILYIYLVPLMTASRTQFYEELKAIRG